MHSLVVTQKRWVDTAANCWYHHHDAICKQRPNRPQMIRLPYRQRTASCRGGSNSESAVRKEEWLQKLPEKKKPLFAHSLPCIEVWLAAMGFFQSTDDRTVWFIQRPDWHAHLSLDVTDLHIRYLKSGPGNLQRDVERKFSYALSREDLENAILGGP